ARRRKNALPERRSLLAASARGGLSDPRERREGQRTRERHTGHPSPPRPKPVRDKRTADEISLAELAPERPRKVAHGPVFDAHRDRDEAVIPRELDERAHVRESARILGRPPQQRARDLELVEVRREGPSGRIRRTDPIDRDARSRRGEPRDCRSLFRTRERLRAELERDRSGSERGDRLEERVDLRQLRRGHVDPDAQRGAEPAPLRPLSGCRTDDPHADLLDELRRERQEVARLEQSEPRVPPAEERFDTAALAAAQVDDRLVPKLELASPQRGEELAISERHLCGLARSSAAFHVRAGELLDDSARGWSF